MPDSRRVGERPGRRWLIAAGAATAWRRFRDESRALPAGAWGRWALVIGVGFAACCAFTAGVTRAGTWLAPRGMQAWDETMLGLIVERSPLSFADATVFESPGNLAYLLPLTAGVVLAAMWHARPILAASMLACYVLQRPLIFLGWWLWDRPRPESVGVGIAAPELHSFPSGHAALAFSAYGLLVYLWMRATPFVFERLLAAGLLLGLVGLVSLSRVRMGTHWPSDVVAGVVIGLAWLLVVIAALRSAERLGAR